MLKTWQLVWDSDDETRSRAMAMMSIHPRPSKSTQQIRECLGCASQANDDRSTMEWNAIFCAMSMQYCGAQWSCLLTGKHKELLSPQDHTGPRTVSQLARSLLVREQAAIANLDGDRRTTTSKLGQQCPACLSRGRTVANNSIAKLVRTWWRFNLAVLALECESECLKKEKWKPNQNACATLAGRFFK